MTALEEIRQSEVRQIEMLMQYRFGLSQQEIDSLSDEEYIDLAAKARYLDEHDAEIVKVGMLMAIGEIAEGLKTG